MQIIIEREGNGYFSALEIKDVTVEDAGKYKVTAKNELGESNATISLNFDSKCSCADRWLLSRFTFSINTIIGIHLKFV